MPREEVPVADIPLLNLVTKMTADPRELIEAYRQIKTAREQTLTSGDSSVLQRELDKLATAAQQSVKAFDPLSRVVTQANREFKDLATAVKAGVVPVAEGVKQYRALETSIKAQLATLSKSSSEYATLSKTMKAAGEEAKRLEAAQRSAVGVYKVDDLKRYEIALKDIATAQKAGLASSKDTVTQYRSLESALAQQLGSLKQGGAEYRSLATIMGQAGQAANKLEGEQKRLEASFRVDALRNYAGELRQIDVAVRSGTSGFDDGIRQIGRLTAELNNQQGELSQTGKEFDQLSRLLQSAAQQQERYQKAAQSAAKANQTSEIRAFGSELKQLEAGLQDTTTALGRLDSQQRAIRYDSAGLRTYRTETESLSVGFDKVGRGLEGLQGKLQTYARGLTEGSREHAELARVMQATEKATVSLAGAQERSQKAYQTAELSRFVTELKGIEQAQKSGIISADQAAKAVTKLQGEFKTYAASLGATERELATFSRSQIDAGRSADTFAQAQERAQRSFDTRALSSFRSELEAIIRGQREGSASFDQTARAVEGLQGRLQEYGSSLTKGGQEQQDLNKLLELSERALTDVGIAAERAGKGFDGRPVREYGTELERLGDSSKTLGSSFDLIERELKELQADLKSDAPRTFAADLDKIVAANKTGAASFEQTQQAVQTLQGEMRTYGSSLGQSESAQAELNRVLDLSERALTSVGTAAERAGRGFNSTPVRDYGRELDGLGDAGERLEGSLTGIEGELEGLGSAFRESGQDARTSADDHEAFGAATRELDGSLAGIEQELSQLGASFRETGDDARTSAGEQERLGTSVRDLGGSLGNTAQEFDRLGGAVRESGQSAGLTQRDYSDLTNVMRELEGASDRLAASQQKNQDAFHAENIRQQVTALADLKLQLERGVISQEQFSTSAREIGTALDQARSGLDVTSRSFAGYVGALTKVESSLAQAEGRIRTFGVASGVAAGVGDQLQNVLFALGPAGEAMGVAMFSAGAGMEGAAVGAKTLNIALTVGLVGGLVAVGVAAIGIAKSMFAIDTGLTDVAKTTGFTGTQLTTLAKSLQGVAVATGTPIKNLLEIASVAGSLGVTGVKNVTQFTEVINKLAIASDIVGEAGAEQLAKFINVTKDASQSVGDAANVVGNVIVRLGNELAATEAPILAMAQRLAGLKVAANVSQVDILGLSGAFVSLGISAELGGTNVTKIFSNMSEAASSGGQALKNFADAAGLTTEEFKKLVKEQPADAFIKLVEGIRAAKDAGDDINPVIKSIVGNNSEMRRVLLAAVGGIDTFSKSMNAARDEGEKLTAMNNELNTRLDSLKGITSLIGQTFAYLGTSIAIALLPVLKNALQGFLDFTRALFGLQPAVEGVGTIATKVGTVFNGLAKTVGVVYGVISDNSPWGKAADNAKNTETALASLGFSFGTAGDASSVLTTRLDALSPKARAAYDSMDLTGRAALSSAEGVKRFGENAQNATGGLQALEQATGRQGLLAAVDVMASTLNGPAKEAFLTVARQAIATGGDVEEVAALIERAFSRVTAASVQASLTVLYEKQKQQQEELNSLLLISEGIKLAGLNADLSAAQAAYDRAAANKQVSAEELATMKAQIVALTELRDGVQVTYDKWKPQIDEVTLRLDSTTNSIKLGKAQLDEFGNSPGPAKAAAGMQATETAAFSAGTALDELAAVQLRYTELQGLSGDQAKVFLDRLLQLKAGYQGNRAEINEMILGTRAYIAEQNKAGDAAEDAAEAAKKLEEAQKQVADANTLLGRGTAVTSQELFKMAMDLGEAASRTDEVGAAARALQTELVKQAVAFDMNTRATEAWNAEIERQQEVVDALKERLGGLAESALATIAPFGEVNSSIQEIDFAAAAFGDTATVAEDKAAVWREEMERLAAAGEQNGLAFKIAAQNYEFWQGKVEAATQAGEIWAAEIERQEGVVENLSQKLGGLGESFRESVTPLGDLSAGLQEIDRNARLTGDSTSVAADKAALYETAMKALASVLGETNPIVEQLRNNFVNYTDVANAQAQATEKQTAWVEKLKTGLGGLAEGFLNTITPIGEVNTRIQEIDRNAQLFGDSSSVAADKAAVWRDELVRLAAEGKTSGIEFANAKRNYELWTAAVEDATTKTKLQIDGLNALGSAFGKVSDVIGAGQLRENLNYLLDARADLLDSGDYDAAEFKRMSEEIAKVRGELEQVEVLGTVFDGLSAGADALAESIANGDSATQQFGAAASAGFLAVSESSSGANEQAGIFFDTLGNAVGQFASGNIFGGFVAIFSGIIDLFGAQAKETDKASAAIEKYGFEWLEANGYISLTSHGVQLNEEALAEHEAQVEADRLAMEEAAEATRLWNEEQAAMAEAAREADQALADLTATIRENTAAAQDAVRDDRLAFAAASGASESVLLVAQTILDLQDESARFNETWAQIAADEAEFIATFLAANPGASEAEARAHAERIFGPQRDALKESIALTSATILLEAGKQAEELGLSQEELGLG